MTSIEVTPSASELLETEAAYAAILPEMSALSEQQLEPMNVEVVSAVTTVLGCLPELSALRPEIVRHLPLFDIERFDKLKAYTLALNHAHALHRGTASPRTSLAEAGDALTDLRDRLYTDASSLSSHGFLDGSRLKECKRAVGYRALATDVFTLVALFKEHWAAIQSRTPVTWQLLQDAGRRATDLLEAVGLREQAPGILAETALVRQRAFTLFTRAYDDARKATLYLRDKQKDADSIAPSLYLGRGGRGKLEAEAEVEESAPTPPAADRTSADTAPRPLQLDNPLGLPITPPLGA